VGGQEFFLIKCKGGPTLFLEKKPKFPPPPPPPRKNVPSLSICLGISEKKEVIESLLKGTDVLVFYQ